MGVHGTVLTHWVPVLVEDICIEELAKSGVRSIFLSVLVLSRAGGRAEIGIKWSSVGEHCHLQVGIIAIAILGCVDRDSVKKSARGVTSRGQLSLRNIAIASSNNDLELISILACIIGIAGRNRGSPQHAFNLSRAAWLGARDVIWIDYGLCEFLEVWALGYCLRCGSRSK